MKSIHSQEIICAPFYPYSGQDIVRRLKAAIDTTENPGGPGLEQKQVADLIGIPRSTLNDWLHDDQVEPIKRFLSGLERLSEENRIKFLRSFCRHCPRLEDPQISHDQQAVAVIEDLIQRGPGITVITGPSDSARTYLLTAIGNSFAARFSTTGFDVHRPMHFAPVPGVYYPATDVLAGTLPSLLATVWPKMAGSKGSMILLNGIWNRIPNHHHRIFKLATKNHVLIADDFTGGQSIRKNRRQNVIRVESIRRRNAPPQFRIHVEVG